MNSAGLHAVGNRLRADRITAEVVPALRAVGVEPVLLKGPTVSAWLYAGEPLARSYQDVDLLVRAADQDRAEAVLRRLGFGEPALATPGEPPTHARAWHRDGDGGEVDLHLRLHGTEHVPADRLWQALDAHLEPYTVAGVTVTALDEVARTLHVALHVNWKDGDGASPQVDLQRALRQVNRSTWSDAAALARQLRAEAQLATRLRSVPDGVAMADDLGLATAPDDVFVFQRALHHMGGAVGVNALQRLAELRGSGRARYVLRKLFPPAAFMRRRSSLANRGRAGLALAYLERVVWCAGRTPAAIAAWVRVRRRLAR